MTKLSTTLELPPAAYTSVDELRAALLALHESGVGSAAGSVEAHEAYVVRRKARIDKEVHAKARGGDMSFGQ